MTASLAIALGTLLHATAPDAPVVRGPGEHMRVGQEVPGPFSLSVAPKERSRRRVALALPSEVRSAVVAQAEVPDVLQNARRLADELRYEEAAVEYQRHLALPDRPIAERARSLFELAFIHFVLGDERTAQERAFQALELDPTLRLGDDAPSRQVKFLTAMRERFQSRTRVEVLPPQDPETPQRIRARLVDPQGNARELLLRHAIGPSGPWFGQRMKCEKELCTAEIPAPEGARTYTAWYFVEALDAQGNTVARGANPEAPLRVSIVEQAPWYRSPWVYAGGAAALIGAAAVFYVASAPP